MPHIQKESNSVTEYNGIGGHYVNWNNPGKEQIPHILTHRQRQNVHLKDSETRTVVTKGQVRVRDRKCTERRVKRT